MVIAKWCSEEDGVGGGKAGKSVLRMAACTGPGVELGIRSKSKHGWIRNPRQLGGQQWQIQCKGVKGMAGK